MYSDFRQVNPNTAGREGWRFRYKGGVLKTFAAKKCADFTLEERTLRDQIAAYLSGDGKLSDPKLAEMKNRAEFAAAEAEKCAVWWHEFGRTPDAEFDLTLPDVVYFGIAGHVEVHNSSARVVVGDVDESA